MYRTIRSVFISVLIENRNKTKLQQIGNCFVKMETKAKEAFHVVNVVEEKERCDRNKLQVISL